MEADGDTAYLPSAYYSHDKSLSFTLRRVDVNHLPRPVLVFVWPTLPTPLPSPCRIFQTTEPIALIDAGDAAEASA